MARVVLFGSLRPLAGGEAILEIDAANIGALLRKLGEDHPGLRPQLDRGVSISIDGTIFRDAWLEPIPPDSEVHVLPRLAGG